MHPAALLEVYVVRPALCKHIEHSELDASLSPFAISELHQ